MKADREQAERRRLDEFLAATADLKKIRGELTRLALAEQQAHRWDKQLPLLTMPGWIPDQPLTLKEVALDLVEPGSGELEALNLDRDELCRYGYWPVGADSQLLTTYSDAIAACDSSRRLEDKPSYRLVAVNAENGSAPGCSLAFTRASYFDGIDTGEPLAFEAALRHVRHENRLTGPYRIYLADPFDLTGRAAMPGINTLTIVLSADGPRFFMHKRGVNAGLSAGVFHVVPAGEFQPQIDDPTIWRSDFHILKNIVREYCEEFLGQAEAYGQGGTTIDYGKPPYSHFFDAVDDGSMRVRFLGAGIDPVSWKPEILTVCVFDEQTFTRIFAGMVPDKVDEGTGGYLLTGEEFETPNGKIYRGRPFDAANVAAYTQTRITLAAGDACLRLAHRWISYLIPS